VSLPEKVGVDITIILNAYSGATTLKSKIAELSMSYSMGPLYVALVALNGYTDNAKKAVEDVLSGGKPQVKLSAGEAVAASVVAALARYNVIRSLEKPAIVEALANADKGRVAEAVKTALTMLNRLTPPT